METNSTEQTEQVPAISAPLVWEWYGKGEWTAYSMLMDPDMCDMPEKDWCKEWCLEWCIRVQEDGRFFAGTRASDPLLLENEQVKSKCWASMSVLKGIIDLAEQTLRSDKFFHNHPAGIARKDHHAITLLPLDRYVEKPK